MLSIFLPLFTFIIIFPVNKDNTLENKYILIITAARTITVMDENVIFSFLQDFP